MSLPPPTREELQRFRFAHGLSQVRLAERLGVAARTVEDWEAERRSPLPMLRLALAAVAAGLPPWSAEGDGSGG